jgi:hypothetical protein
LLASSNQPSHLIPRLEKMDDDQQRVNELFQVMFARAPDAEESTVVGAFLSNRASTTEAIRQVAWSMLTSAEFRYNH